MKKLMLLMIGCVIVQGSVNAMEPLVDAARNGDVKLVGSLLASGVNVDKQIALVKRRYIWLQALTVVSCTTSFRGQCQC